MKHFLIYTPSLLAFVAAVIAIKGGTWNKKKSGVKKITITGWLTVTVAFFSCAISIAIIYETTKSAENYASELRAALDQINSKVDSKSKELLLSHIMIDMPAELLNIDGRTLVLLEDNGAVLEITNSGPAMCGGHSSIADNGMKLNIALCTPGAQFIYHPIKIESAHSKVNALKIHLEIAVEKPFVIVRKGTFKVIHPEILARELFGYHNLVNDNTVYGCPNFLILNKSYNERYVLCGYEFDNQDIGFEDQTQKKVASFVYR